MERQLAVWESPKVTRSLSAEVTAYADIWGLAGRGGASEPNWPPAALDDRDGRAGGTDRSCGCGCWDRRPAAGSRSGTAPARCAVRSAPRACVPRTQSSIAVSADTALVPVQRLTRHPSQIESFPQLHPTTGRAMPLQAVLLTDAELDHTLGLLLMREGRGLGCTRPGGAQDPARVRGAEDARAYCPVKWRPVMPGADVPLADGLSYRAFDVPTSKRVRFAPEARRTAESWATG